MRRGVVRRRFARAAQKYPEKPIRYISPYPTGGSQILALLVSGKLGFNAARDFQAITQTANLPHLMVVHPSVPATIPFINSGKLRGLALLATERVPTLPNLPTSKDAGLPELLLDSWYGVMAPAGVRADIVEPLISELKKVMRARHREATRTRGHRRGDQHAVIAWRNAEITAAAQI